VVSGVGLLRPSLIIGVLNNSLKLLHRKYFR
jgi:hypothetical protein